MEWHAFAEEPSPPELPENNPDATDSSEPQREADEECLLKITADADGRKDGLNRQDFGLIAAMCFLNYCSFVCYSLIAPFFPKEVIRKGGNQALASWIFGSYELTAFLICPLFGKYMHTIGPRFLAVSGTFVTGTACVLFGLLSMVEDYRAFVTLAFLIRMVEAVGAGAFLTASLSIVANRFPTKLGTVQGFLETASGIGICTGPTIGGALFSVSKAGGFWTPFAVVGSVLVVAGLLAGVVLPAPEICTGCLVPSPSIWKMLRIPAVALSVATIICGAMSIGFYEPTLELHIDKLVHSPVEVGLVFLASAGTYALSSPLWGYAADHVRYPKILIMVGCVFVAVSFLLIGPAPFLGLKLELWLVIVALLVHGIGLGAQITAPLRDILTAVLASGMENNPGTRSVTSGMFASAFSLGAFLGPVIGGSLIDVISFEWSAFIVTCLNFLLVVVLGTFLVLHWRRSSTSRVNYQALAQ